MEELLMEVQMYAGRLQGDDTVKAHAAVAADVRIDAVQQETPQSAAHPGRAVRVVIAATFSVEPLQRSLEFWLSTLQIDAEVVLAPYAQVIQGLLSPQSVLSKNQTGCNALLIRLQDWYPAADSAEADVIGARSLNRAVQDFHAALSSFHVRGQGTTLVLFCPSSLDLSPEKRERLARAEVELKAKLGTLPGVQCFDHAEVVHSYPLETYEDAAAERLGHIPYTEEYFAALATVLARRIAALSKPRFKVIVVDCDNTLWKGICGEDGVTGIGLTPEHIRFQELLVQQHHAGALLCLCTKNNEVDVDEVFRHHTGMPLRKEHLIAARVNWRPKSDNLRELASELDLALESFVFIDDSPVECAEVRAHCPSVLTLQFPHAAQEIGHFLEHVWAFDRPPATEEALRRTTQYRENFARKAALQGAVDLRQFLESLELVIDIAPLEARHLARVEELVQRTNQFNLTTIRRRESEIEALWRSGALQGRVVTVRDRFGDYGLVGAVLFRAGIALEVDTFVLSCRALGRGVEHRVVNELGRLAHSQGQSHILLGYRRTARNTPAWEFLTSTFAQFRSAATAGSDDTGDCEFAIPVEFAERAAVGAGDADGAKEPSGADPRSSGDSVGNTSASHAWHERAYQLSRIPELFTAMNEAWASTRSLQSQYVPPNTPLESAIAAIWQDVLRIERVGVSDDFLELGGDSIQAVRVLARVGSLTGRQLTLGAFFAMPTVTAVASKLGQADPFEPSIGPAARAEPAPLSWAQQRLWFIHQLEGASCAYHIPLALRLTGDLDVASVHVALNTVLSRHEALRTTFSLMGGEPVQVIAQASDLDLAFCNYEALLADERDAALKTTLQEEQLAPFDLSAGPLIRAKLIRFSSREHVLLFTMHHMIGDGWSLGVLVKELAESYRAARENAAHSLPALPIQYADYALWQRQLPAGLQREHLSYWTEQLQGAPELLELPTDRPRPALQSYRGGSVPIRLAADLSAGLQQFAHRHQATLATVLYTAWSILLARLSGQEDIVFGLPVANRRRVELEGLIGLFVNTLPIRVQVQDDPKVSAVLERVKTLLLEASLHQEVPFERIVEAVNPTRSLSHSPIFQVMFALQPKIDSELQAAGVHIRHEEVPLHTAQFDLLLSLRETPAGLAGHLNFAADLFDESTIQRWAGHFSLLLHEMVHNPECDITRLKVLNEQERLEILQRLNATAHPYAQGKLLHELFEDQVGRSANEVAVICGDESLTYAELNGRANRLARYLQDRGVGPGRLVGICVERSLEMMVGLVGILKSGGAYLPLDPSYPPERLAYMLEDAHPAIVLTQPQLKSRLPTAAAHPVTLDSEWTQIALGDSSDPNPHAVGLRSDDLAYVIYTSGSTGKPKGAMNEHGGLVNRLQWMQDRYGLVEQDRVLQKTPFSFDVSAWEIFWTLSTGAALVIARPEGHKDSGYLREVIETTQVTTLHFVPSMLQVFLQEHRAGSCPSLRRVICSGEELPASLRRLFFQCFPRVELHNLYGPTEAAIDVTAWQCTPQEQGERVPIGYPIHNIQMYVLDKHREPVPIGVRGEIYIGGVGVGRGYLNKPELTEQRFVPDPFGANAKGRLYRTGDLGRWRGDGALEYLGRNDYQVKIRGFRIELGEIEATLAQQPEIREAVVLAREDVVGEKRLVAYLTLRGEIPGGLEALGQKLAGVLPDYMVPSAFVVLEQMPLSPNGKLERRALPAPEREAFAGRPYAAPEGHIEQLVAGIWCRLLHIDRVGREDDFFRLGGHSLLATRLIARTQTALSIEIPLRTIFDYPTVHGFAHFVERLLHANLLERVTEGGTELEAILAQVMLMPEGDVETLLRELGEELPL
jgi:amino acid adenylation domain-containing protein/FkbH-like protein